MEELIEILKMYKEKSFSVEAYTIILKEEDGYYRHLIVSDFNGNIYDDKLP